MSISEVRSKNLGTIAGVSREFPKETSLEVFRRMCLSRNFELYAKRAYDEKLIKAPIYLSLGQEAVSSALSVSFEKPCIFAQHRAHDLYLAYGGNPVALVDELLHRESGCAQGMGGSASLHSPEIGMFGHSGLLGDQIPIATGFALGSGKRTLAILGDATAEEDYVLGALGYAAHKKLPILFVCIDNDLSILTKVKVRRSWNICEVAKAFGMPAVDIADDPWVIMHHVSRYKETMPAFMNVRVVRHLWHSGTGKDCEPEWDRFALVKEELATLGLEKERDEIEIETAKKVDAWWSREFTSTTSS